MNPTVELFLIRHGVTEWNLQRRYQGHTDVELSDEGRTQAAGLSALVQRLRNEVPTALYSSDLQRARETARLACGPADIILDPRLRELRFGAFEGLTFDECSVKFADLHSRWRSDPVTGTPPEAESVHQFHERLGSWLKELTGPRVIAFTHGGVLRALASLTQNQMFDVTLSVPPIAIVRLQLDERRMPLPGSAQWL